MLGTIVGNDATMQSETMNETTPATVMTWRFLRRHFVRIVIGVVLVVAVSITVFVWMPYQRELRIARLIRSLGGKVHMESCGPNWVPQETGLWGKPITKSSIGELVHYKYPAWDNTAAAVISQQKATEADRFIGETSVSNPNLGAAYRVFDTKAKQVSDAVGRDSVKPDKLAVLTDEFRKVAVQLSLQDPNFKGFYKTHYERLFGPLEVFSQ